VCISYGVGRIRTELFLFCWDVNQKFKGCLWISLVLIVLASCRRERVNDSSDDLEKPSADYCIRLHVREPLSSTRNFLKSESISASQCVVIKQKREKDVSAITISYNIHWFKLIYQDDPAVTWSLLIFNQYKCERETKRCRSSIIEWNSKS
jgi:hypothetical protein